MYSTRAGLVLAFHGCDRALVHKVLNNEESLLPSTNSYDWLGSGIYFWENSPSRALEYAEHLSKNPIRAQKKINDPAVIGAVLNLGYCLDLLDYENLQLLKAGFNFLKNRFENSDLPANRPVGGLKELLLRELDCAVIETLHELQAERKAQPFDSVRGMFTEGAPIYPLAGFQEKSHIQVCIRNPNCIKGFFLPRELDNNHLKV